MVSNGDESLAEYFWAVARELRHRSRETLAPWDISPSHGRAISVLELRGSIRLTELAERLHIAPRSATEVVDALQEHGFVERRPDPDDRRATLIVLTDEGTRASAAIRAARSADADQFFGALSASDRSQLRRILRALAGSST